MPAFTWGVATWGIKPVSQHLRMVPDFASFRGFLVLGGNQVSSIFDANWVTGQVSFFSALNILRVGAAARWAWAGLGPHSNSTRTLTKTV